jgi:hypothetical protein
VAVRQGALAAALLAASLLGERANPRLASGLEAGMQLLYESEGERQPPWSIDSVTLGATLRERSECAVVHLRRRPDQTSPDEHRLCLAHDTLYRWEAKRAVWTILRPVGPRMTWTTRQVGGDVVLYQTEETAKERISGRSIPVVHTTVTTSDSAGRPKRRLRERYALSLTTATGGTFELPDSGRAGEWRVQQGFELPEIRRGASPGSMPSR